MDLSVGKIPHALNSELSTYCHIKNDVIVFASSTDIWIATVSVQEALCIAFASVRHYGDGAIKLPHARMYRAAT